MEAINARSVSLVKDLRPTKSLIVDSQQDILQANFILKNCTWFRIVVTNDNGNRAYTNAYFLKDLL